MAKELEVGMKAPHFKLPNQDGVNTSLDDFKGQTVVLYFYPKDMTPGCTQQASDFRDVASKLKRKKVVVVGVSLDSPERHQKFIKKYDLNFQLLADERAKVSKAYGVYKQKSLYGHKFMGIERTTFIINGQRKIAKIFPKVKVTDHVTQLVKTLFEDLR